MLLLRGIIQYMKYHDSRLKDITGKRFGRLTVLYVLREDKKWLCKCDCGNYTKVAATHLRTGHTVSCGCRAKEQRESLPAQNTTHGYYLGGKPDLFIATYNSMVARCYNPNSPCYRRYGGRGIGVCEEWKNSKVAFHKWCEETYIEGRTLDRIDNNRGYSPDNCRWATKTQQARNRKSNVVYQTSKGIGCQAELSKVWGISEKLVSARIHRGWAPEKAFSTPPRQGNYHRKSCR